MIITTTVKPFYGTTTRGSGLNRLIKLIRKPLASTLNQRWVSKHNPAMVRYNVFRDGARKVMENTAGDLFLARELDPDKKVIGENIIILEKLVSDIGATLPNALLLLIQSGLATYSELVDATEHSSSAIHRASIKQLKEIDPELARELVRKKRKKRLKQSAFMLAAGVSAIFILILGYNLAAYSNGNPSAIRRAYKYEIISQKTLVSKLIITLKYGNQDVRYTAADALGNIGPSAKEAVPALIAALKDSNSRVRKEAADALGNNIVPSAKEAVPALIAALKDSDRKIRDAAANALGKIGSSAKEAVPALIAALKDSDRKIRNAATKKALGNIGPSAKEAVPALLIAALKNRHWNARLDVGYATAVALCKIDPATKEAVPALGGPYKTVQVNNFKQLALSCCE